MSASKDHYGVPGGRGGRPFDFSEQRPCPVCGKGWCQGYADGTVLCKRVPSTRRKVNADGVEFYVHRPDGALIAAALPSLPATAARASDVVLGRVYSIVLARCPLLDAHRANLRARGLDDGAVARNGYGSLRVEGRAAIARAIVDAVGEAAALGVPGVAWREIGGRRWLTFTGAAGLLVPTRDLAGRVVALLVRRDDAGEGGRYLYVSSARHGGASARNAVHVPRFDGDRATVRVTEGPLKGDCITSLTGTLTLALPGVGAWRKALDPLAAIEPRRVRVAFDMDRLNNPVVANAQRDLVRALRAARYAVAVESWDPAFKGLDDFLAAKRTGEAA